MDVRTVVTLLLMGRYYSCSMQPSFGLLLSYLIVWLDSRTADESRGLQDNHTRPSDSDTSDFSLAFVFPLSLPPSLSLMRLSCHKIGWSISRSLLPPLNFYYSISPSLTPSHPGTQAALSLIHRITIHEFIEEYDTERMVLTTSLRGSTLMDPSFFHPLLPER